MTIDRKFALLTCTEMGAADSAAIAAGTPGAELMENAGRGVAETVLDVSERGARVIVLCGPGNNGGDGYVAARLLAKHDRDVVVVALGDPGKLTGDAKTNFSRWDGGLTDFSEAVVENSDVIVDALFGAGLSRPLEGAAAEWVAAANASAATRVAVDIPSGVMGDTGAADGPAFAADITVTFCCKKRGHALSPGRFLSGAVRVVDIGISGGALEKITPMCFENDPDLFRTAIPPLDPMGHKYSRGHLVVVGGAAEKSGAARLAAAAGLRTGAGLATIACPEQAAAIYAAGQASIMTEPCGSIADFRAFITDERRNTIVLGPGNGVGDDTRERVVATLQLRKNAVIDADAITSFRDDPAALFAAIESPVVFTPHLGEFQRLWPDLAELADRLESVAQAAYRAGAVVLLKGPETVIAAPDGPVLINANAPPSMATAGSGDVLSGMIGAFLAQGADPFWAAAAATWVHGAAAGDRGRGLIAEDVIDGIPAALADAGIAG